MRAVLACLLLLIAAPAAACDLARPIVFAGLDWDSAQFHTAVAARILERGYGCRTDVLAGSTIPLVQGVAQGQVDVIMEVWKDNVTEVWQRALAKGQVREIGVNFPDAVQGWYVPRETVEGPKAPAAGLRGVADLPRFARVFADPEEPAKGRFYNCPAGWNCEVVNSAKLRAYGLDASYTNFRPGTGAALAAAIGGAVLRHQPILAYYWGPTAVLGKYDLVRLEEPAWNEADWRGLATDPHYPRAVAYPQVAVWIGANAAFADSAPAIVAFLKAYRTDSNLINEALADMQDNGGDAKAAATHFLSRHPEVWQNWVPPDVAARVRSGL